MESKKINQLATELAPDLSDLTIIGDPTTGISKKITLSQMASLFTGTVEEYATLAAFPLVGVADTIYIALDTNIIYRYDTSLSAYVILSPNIINSLVFSDANGFDGTITLVGSVATLSITTALTLGSVPFIGASGALIQDNSNLFFDDTNNRLGIATASPTTPLDVFGSGIIGRLNATSTNNAYLGFASNGTNKWSAGNVQSDHRFRIFSEANSAELITILQTGEFGIGIANPLTKLHIDGGATALIANLDANVSVAKSVSFRSDNSSRINLEVSGTESGSNAGADLFLRTFTDAGALLETPFQITRSTGLATFKNIAITGLTSGYLPKANGSSALSNSLIWDNGTNVGIGNTNTSYTLDVSGTGRFTNTTLLAASSGNVGIGTSIAPVGNLNIQGGSPQYIVLTNTAADGVADVIQGGIIGQARGSGNNLSQMASILFRNNATSWFKGDITFNTNDSDGTNPAVGTTERFRITSAGNVGIGTSSPTALVQIQGAQSGVSGKNLTISYNGTYYAEYTEKSIAAFNNELIFGTGTGGAERMRITSAGNVGVGISGVYSDVRLMSRGASATASDYSFRAENSTGGNLFFARNDGLLNTGLAAQSPYNLTIAASANCHIFSDGALFRATSSKRYKTDIEDLSVNTFELINKIRPVWYRSLCERDKKDWSWYGFIAEELAEIDPRFVQFGYASEDYIKDVETNETKLKEGAELRADGVMYDRLTVLLIKGMQEQQLQIQELKKDIELLKAK